MEILKSTHNICFYEELTKIIFEFSSNRHVISSSVSDLDIHCWLSPVSPETLDHHHGEFFLRNKLAMFFHHFKF